MGVDFYWRYEKGMKQILVFIPVFIPPFSYHVFIPPCSHLDFVPVFIPSCPCRFSSIEAPCRVFSYCFHTLFIPPIGPVRCTTHLLGGDSNSSVFIPMFIPIFIPAFSYLIFIPWIQDSVLTSVDPKIESDGILKFNKPKTQNIGEKNPAGDPRGS